MPLELAEIVVEEDLEDLMIDLSTESYDNFLDSSKPFDLVAVKDYLSKILTDDFWPRTLEFFQDPPTLELISFP